MKIKTAAGTYSPLLALGVAAVIGGCATQEDAPLPQFSQAPVVEAIYATDIHYGATLGRFDVQLWANPNDPHYPNLVGETGAQNAADVSLLPASYDGLIVEFNIPLNGTLAGAVNNLTGDVFPEGDALAPVPTPETYCTAGSNPATAPFKVVDVDANSTPVLGSICYDPTSQLFRYPSFTFILGENAATDPSAQPFTCQDFNPDTGDTDKASWKPLHNYAIQFNTALIQNENGNTLVLPTDSAWSNGAFVMKSSGFEIMAAGFDDPSTGFFTWVDKPYKGFQKDCPANAIACNPVNGTYLQPNADAPFRIYTTMAVGDVGPITATRADGSSFDVHVVLSGTRGHMMAYVEPPGCSGDSNPANLTCPWEPGQSYIINVGGTLTSASGTYTISAPATYKFTAAPGSIGPYATVPADGTTAVDVYNEPLAGGSGPVTLLIDLTAPVDPTTVTTANFTLTGPTGPVAGAVQVAPGLNEQEILFTPTAPLASSTVYTLSAANLKVDPAVPNFPAGSAFPTISAKFTTSAVNAALYSVDLVAGALVALDNQPAVSLTIFADDFNFSAGFGVGLVTTDFTRPVAGLSSSTVVINELNADGTVGAAIPATDVQIENTVLDSMGDTSPQVWDVGVTYSSTGAAPYSIKCSQGYQITLTTTIADTDETPAVNLKAEGCKSGTCNDIHSFTTESFAPLGGTITYTPATSSTPDTFEIDFPGSLDHTTVNPLLEAGTLMSLVDGNGNKVPLTCPDLPDDNELAIICTANSTLAANANYTASMLVLTSTPLKIAPLATFYFADVNGAPIAVDAAGDLLPEQFPADQVSCQFAGTLLVPFTTGCAQSTTRAPARAHRGAGLTSRALPVNGRQNAVAIR